MEAGIVQNVGEQLDDLMAECVFDIKVTCGSLFEDTFYAPFSILHDQIFEIINKAFREGKRKIAIAAPRGIGKTSIARAVAARSILFRLHHFIVYLSNSATSAEMQTENLKRDLISSKMVRQLFGNIKENINSEKGLDESFSKSAWTAFGDVFVLPRGAGQQVRGLNWNNYRPGLVIIDDLEDKDEIRSEDNRKKLKSWFNSDLMKTEGRYEANKTIFIYIDTIKHEDSILAGLMESPEWLTIQLSICDENYKSYDNNYMTDEEIAAEVAEHRREGTLDEFYMERMNIPISKEDAVFKQEHFKNYQDDFTTIKLKNSLGEVEEIKRSDLLHVTMVDPARTVKLQSADSAVITVAVSRSSRKIFVRRVESRKFFPDELYDEMFNQVREFGSFFLGVDVVGLSNFITQPIENEMRSRKLFPILVELPAKRSKEERVATLAPLYKLGYLYHNEYQCAKLEGQLLSFPRSKLWDCMDCLAYINYIMDKHAIYFDPPDDANDEPELDEFDELDDEEMMISDQMGLII